ncbi:MAG: uracil-DNA glycosylase family protein [Octadecabacter sp.]|nr:uracil-DNA glycosylase family protein [Octadecabacter sp.]
MTRGSQIADCTPCADCFAPTHTSYASRSFIWFKRTARLLVAGQTPGMIVHKSGRRFTDLLEDPLRGWLDLNNAIFYDRNCVTKELTAYYFSGYYGRWSDQLPPKICGQTCYNRVIGDFLYVHLRILIGASGHSYYLGLKIIVIGTVAESDGHVPDTFVLPHSSWRNIGWLKKNSWSAEDILPSLRARVKEVLND